MVENEEFLFDIMVNLEKRRIKEEEEQEWIKKIHAFIDKRTEEDEDGEPPDEDTIIEALNLEKQEDLVSKAYELYWNKAVE